MTRPSAAAPRDSLDLRAIRDGGRREIPWDAPIVPALDAEGSKRVGEAWRSRMEQEHLAVGAFSRLALDLAEVGCDSVVLALVTRAAADEVRHADLCRRVAVRHLGEDAVPARLRGLAGFASRPGLASADDVLLRVVEMCCLSETFTGAYFTEMIERTGHPMARAAVESLLEDEIDHGRVGWAYLAQVKRDGGGAALDRALPELLVATVKPVFDEAVQYPEKDDPRLEAHAYLSTAAARTIYARTLGDVILPGFDALGVATEKARSMARAEGWIRA
jgi:hypothetical protein